MFVYRPDGTKHTVRTSHAVLRRSSHISRQYILSPLSNCSTGRTLSCWQSSFPQVISPSHIQSCMEPSHCQSWVSAATRRKCELQLACSKSTCPLAYSIVLAYHGTHMSIRTRARRQQALQIILCAIWRLLTQVAPSGEAKGPGMAAVSDMRANHTVLRAANGFMLLD